MTEIAVECLAKVSGPLADPRIGSGAGPSSGGAVSLGRGPALLLVVAVLVAAATILLFTQGARQQDFAVLIAAFVIFVGLVVFGLVAFRLHVRVASLRERMALVESIAAAGDARFGPEPVARRMLLVLRDHYLAEICVLLLAQPRQPPRLFCLEAGAATAVEFPPEALTDLLPPLLSVPSGLGVVFNRKNNAVWQRETDACNIHDQATEWPAGKDERAMAEAVASALDCPSFVSVPLSREIRVGGRLFIGTRQRRFGAADVALLRPVIEQVTLMLENTCLLNMLAVEAAEYERQRIARDLHDSAIQPYIGLKFGLEALARKLRQHPAVAHDIQHLIERTSGEIADMRQLISGLADKSGNSRDSLSASLRRQTARYSELFGISVEISSEGEQRVSRSLAREILHMVSEGLSNICRHTPARQVWIDLRHLGASLELRISNDRSGSKGPPSFVPCSLSERAAALGGSVDVNLGGERTEIAIRIPLEE